MDYLLVGKHITIFICCQLFFCPAAACGSDLRTSVTLPYTWLVDFRSVYSPRIHFRGIRWISYHLRGEVDSRSVFSPKMYCIWQIIFRYILYIFFLSWCFTDLDICTFVYSFLCPAAGMFWPDRTNRLPFIQPRTAVHTLYLISGLFRSYSCLESFLWMHVDILSLKLCRQNYRSVGD